MISNHIYMNKKEGSAFENNDLSNLAPEYIKTDGDYDLFIISLFLSISSSKIHFFLSSPAR